MNTVNRTGRNGQIDFIINSFGLFFDSGLVTISIKLKSVGVDERTGVATNANILIDNYFLGHVFFIISDRFGQSVFLKTLLI